MAARTIKRIGVATRLIDRLREIDPAGTYARYSAYASVIAVLAAAGGFALTLASTDAAHAKFGAIYAGILTTIAMASAQPGPDHRPVRQIATIGGAILICAAIGVVAAPLPVVAQPLVVVIAFMGFYVRRWPEPWPSAGLLGVLAYLIHQILAPYLPQAAMGHGIPAAFAGVAVGYWFLPRTMFTSGLVDSARRLRAAVPHVLRVHLEAPGEVRATVKRLDALLSRVNDARAQADRFDARMSKRHLSLVNAAAVVARVWENTAESLNATEQSVGDVPSDSTEAVGAATAAVADAIERPSPEAHGRALAALDALDRSIAKTVGGFSGGAENPAEKATFALLNAELTLSHLLEAVSRLDEELAGWRKATA